MNFPKLGLTLLLAGAIAHCWHLPLCAQPLDLTGQGRPSDRNGAASRAVAPHLEVNLLR